MPFDLWLTEACFPEQKKYVGKTDYRQSRLNSVPRDLSLTRPTLF